MTSLVISIILIYLIWLVIMFIGWISLKPSIHIQSLPSSCSLIIPFRNEAIVLSQLLRALESIKSQSPDLEIIMVDDHSEDHSNVIIELSKLDIRLLHLEEGDKGKKAALTHGINNAKGDIIITTDADCIFQAQWIDLLTTKFTNPEIKMVCGGVGFGNEKGFFQALQAIEFAPVLGAGAASIHFGHPIMCNGANLAFRKSTFMEVKGYEGNAHIASGDDEFLMHKIQQKYPKAIAYEKHQKAVVTTRANASLAQLINQKKRWAGKWTANFNLYKIALALLIFFNATAYLAAYFLLFISSNYHLGIFILVKIFFEGIFIQNVLKNTGRTFPFFSFLIVQILYPFYVILIGIIANFGQYNWKGRSY